VRYVLEGSVRKANNRVRITAQLVDATTGHHVWAERYDRELRDIFALQDEITHKIVFALKVKLTEEEQERFRHSPTDNLEAYDAFLRGGEYYSRATKEANAQARQLFEQAIALDPQYSAAYALLGLTHWLEWMYQWSQNPQTLEQAFDLAQKAVDLDDSLPLAHMLLGRAYLAKKQLERALAEAERAIALDPNDADGYAHLAAILNFAGRPKEAIGSLEKAMRLNPHYPYWYLHHLGVAYTFTRRIEEATVAFKRVLTHNPDFLPAHTFLAAIYSALGREQEARAEAAAVLRISPNFSLEVQRQMLPVTDQAGAELFFDLLRKAGLK
jgi:adenylate cyclase